MSRTLSHTSPFTARAARLTSSLLVRKGDAAPAGIPPRHPDVPLVQVSPPVSEARAAPLRAISEAEPQTAAASPGAGATVNPAGPTPAAGRTGRAGGGGSGERFATTLRLDPVRHYRLKLFAARQRTEVQDLLVRAVDAYLEARAGDCPCLRGGPKACTC